MKAGNILETIGQTPHVHLKKLFPSLEVWLKLESMNPGGSIKDRIAVSMIEDAEKNGKLGHGGVIIEPTSGNTGIGLAMAGTVKGYRVILVMPDTMSVERRSLLVSYGAELVLTEGSKGMKGAVEKAMEMAVKIPGSFMPMQFENIANPMIHAKTTAQEIIGDFPEGLDFMFAGIGTGGHISGAGRVLREKFPGIRIFGVEPSDSPVLNGGEPGPHKIQGIGAGFIPAALDREVAESIETVANEDAYEMTRRLARLEGIIAGISTGAVLSAVAIKEKQKKLKLQSRIITFAYDTGERYISNKELWNG